MAKMQTGSKNVNVDNSDEDIGDVVSKGIELHTTLHVVLKLCDKKYKWNTKVILPDYSRIEIIGDKYSHKYLTEDDKEDEERLPIRVEIDTTKTIELADSYKPHKVQQDPVKLLFGNFCYVKIRGIGIEECINDARLSMQYEGNSSGLFDMRGHHCVLEMTDCRVELTHSSFINVSNFGLTTVSLCHNRFVRHPDDKVKRDIKIITADRGCGWHAREVYIRGWRFCKLGKDISWEKASEFVKYDKS